MGMEPPMSVGDATWNFAVRKMNHAPGYVAWCAKTKELGNGPLEVEWGLEVHVEIADTADGALAKLKREVFN